MKYLFVVEPSTSLHGTIKQCLKEVAEDTAVAFFDSKKSMLEILLHQKEIYDTPLENIHVIGLILDLDGESAFEEQADRHLLENIVKCTKGESVPKVIGLRHLIDEDRDNPERLFKDYVENILNKPLDYLLFKNQLKLIFDNGSAVVSDILYSHQAKSAVEIIKEVSVDRITELGFRTRSKRELPIKKRSRYFGRSFLHKSGMSLFAQCYLNVKDGDEYLSSFGYFGHSHEHSSELRRRVRGNQSKIELKFEEGSSNKKFDSIYIGSNKKVIAELEAILNGKFSNCSKMQMFNKSTFSYFLGAVDFKMPKEIDLGEYNIYLDPQTKKILGFYRYLKKDIEINQFLGQPLKGSLGVILKSLNIAFTDELLDSLGSAEGTTLDLEYKNTPLVLKFSKFQNSFFGDGTALKIKMDLQFPKEYLDATSSVASFSNTTFIFLDLTEKLAPDSLVEYLKNRREEGQSVVLYGIGSTAIKNYLQLAKLNYLDDYFVLPLDSYHLTRKMKMQNPDLLPSESDFGGRFSITTLSKIYAANPVAISAISEAHVEIIYKRKLRVGEYRRFALWIPGEDSHPIFGVCKSSEDSGSGEFLCKFSFYGVHEHSLQNIRRWIKENYIESKNKS